MIQPDKVEILIVDDSPLAIARLKKLFESEGHKVVGDARNGRQAMTLYKSLHPELVTLGYLLAEKNGEAVLREILRHDPRAKVIMISGVMDGSIEERALQAGAKGFFRKFHEPKDCLNLIDRVMECQ